MEPNRKLSLAVVAWLVPIVGSLYLVVCTIRAFNIRDLWTPLTALFLTASLGKCFYPLVGQTAVLCKFFWLKPTTDRLPCVSQCVPLVCIVFVSSMEHLPCSLVAAVVLAFALMKWLVGVFGTMGSCGTQENESDADVENTAPDSSKSSREVQVRDPKPSDASSDFSGSSDDISASEYSSSNSDKCSGSPDSSDFEESLHASSDKYSRLLSETTDSDIGADGVEAPRMYARNVDTAYIPETFVTKHSEKCEPLDSRENHNKPISQEDLGLCAWLSLSWCSFWLSSLIHVEHCRDAWKFPWTAKFILLFQALGCSGAATWALQCSCAPEANCQKGPYDIAVRILQLRYGEDYYYTLSPGLKVHMDLRTGSMLGTYEVGSEFAQAAWLSSLSALFHIFCTFYPSMLIMSVLRGRSEDRKGAPFDLIKYAFSTELRFLFAWSGCLGSALTYCRHGRDLDIPSSVFWVMWLSPVLLAFVEVAAKTQRHYTAVGVNRVRLLHERLWSKRSFKIQVPGLNSSLDDIGPSEAMVADPRNLRQKEYVETWCKGRKLALTKTFKEYRRFVSFQNKPDKGAAVKNLLISMRYGLHIRLKAVKVLKEMTKKPLADEQQEQELYLAEVLEMLNMLFPRHFRTVVVHHDLEKRNRTRMDADCKKVLALLAALVMASAVALKQDTVAWLVRQPLNHPASHNSSADLTSADDSSIAQVGLPAQPQCIDWLRPIAVSLALATTICFRTIAAKCAEWMGRNFNERLLEIVVFDFFILAMAATAASAALWLTELPLVNALLPLVLGFGIGHTVFVHHCFLIFNWDESKYCMESLVILHRFVDPCPDQGYVVRFDEIVEERFSTWPQKIDGSDIRCRDADEMEKYKERFKELFQRHPCSHNHTCKYVMPLQVSFTRVASIQLWHRLRQHTLASQLGIILNMQLLLCIRFLGWLALVSTVVINLMVRKAALRDHDNLLFALLIVYENICWLAMWWRIQKWNEIVEADARRITDVSANESLREQERSLLACLQKQIEGRPHVNLFGFALPTLQTLLVALLAAFPLGRLLGFLHAHIRV